MKKIALIIGLEYFGESKLDGCYNDALNIISSIKNLYKFNNDEIIFINDRENSNHGSRSQIIKCLNYVVNGNYDFIFFYYAGHGGYTNDYSGDENNLHSKFIMNNNSCKDSFFYTIEDNNRLGKLYDDTIKQILTNLSSTSTFLGLIDCCHSGTIFDCDYIYFPNKTNRLKSKKINYLLDNCSNGYDLIESCYKNNSRHIKGNVCLISASRDNQSAYESYNDGRSQGNFTYNACRLLNKCKYKNISIYQFVLTICNLLDDNKQVAVCTSSNYYDLKQSYIYNNNRLCPYFCPNNNVIKHIEYLPEIKKPIKTWKDLFQSFFTSRSLDNLNYNNYLVYLIVSAVTYKYYKKH